MTRLSIPLYLKPNDPVVFPDVELAMTDPDGLLAVGGDLSPQRLIAAYQQGIFPWFSHDQPILWWSPNPRLLLFPERLHVSRSLKKFCRSSTWQITFDQAFEHVMRACSDPRAGQNGTWITEDMVNAYLQLHQMGIAHSIECWDEDELIGGLYGVCLGKVFFGESMFSRRSNASKFAFVSFIEQFKQWGGKLVDCQVTTNHLLSLGAENVSRREFSTLLHKWCRQQASVWNRSGV